MKPPRAALAVVAVLALVGLALGVRTAWRELTRPARELAALAKAREAARGLSERFGADLDALAARAHEDVLPADALAGDAGVEDVAILSLDRKEPLVVWHRAAGPSPDLEAIARAMRGDEVVGELATLGLRDPPGSTAKVWSRGVEGGLARATLVVARRRGARVVVALGAARVPVEG